MMISQSKIERIQKTMCSENIDGLYCRLSVNVLALTGYWPGNHAVAAVIPSEGKTVLLAAETEYDNVISEINKTLIDVEAYSFESSTELRGITDSMLEDALPRIFKKLGLSEGTIGIEKSFEDGASARMLGDFKYPSEPTWQMLMKAFPRVLFTDATQLIQKLRWVKTPEEIECIKKSVNIACMGFEAVRKNIRAGMTEAEVSAILEGEILSQGTGRNDANYSRGFSSVYSGPRSSGQWVHWACSSGRVVEEDDMVIMELGSVTDGYWCDLTRNTCAGQPSKKAENVMETVLEAQKKGVSVIKPGTPVGEIDKACHSYFEKSGYGKEFHPHPCGHGTGFNYHEGPPVHKACDILLEEGMVLCVEPGLYFDGEFGIRAEDMFVVTKTGAQLLSNYSHSFK